MPVRCFKFIQRFSYHQQYLIVCVLSLILLVLSRYWWCFILLPLSTVAIHQLTKRLSQLEQAPFLLSGRLYETFIRKGHLNSTADSPSHNDHDHQMAIQKECDTYIRIIIARYVCVWYYPFISTNQEFLEDLTILLNMVLNRLSSRLKSLNIYELSRSIVNLQQIHVDQYLQALDSYRRHPRSNRLTKSLVEEFHQQFRLHPSLVGKDIHAYLRALIELFLTDLLPESFPLYSASPTGRELFTQILTNAIFLPLFHRLSQPRMVYYLIVLLWETDEQKRFYENEENSVELGTDENEQGRSIDDPDEPIRSDEQQNEEDPSHEEKRKLHLEKIIYSATIHSTDRAYNAASGAAYTVYIIQCRTKSPFASDAIHDYTIRRRFSEFLNLHKRLQRNPITCRHCYELDEIFRNAPIPLDNMNPDVIRRRRVILEQYIQKVIANDVLNCSHDVLEFFAYNSDPNIAYEALSSTLISVPRFDRALLQFFRRTYSRAESVTPIREKFQLNISTVYEDRCPIADQLKLFIQQTSLRCSSQTPTLNLADQNLFQTLMTRPSIPRKLQRDEPSLSEIPLTDALLNFAHTCLHSREAVIRNESIHRILRTLVGHLVEKFVRNELDEIFSPDQILKYLEDIRTKVLWPDDNKTFVPMKNVKRRAYHACINKIPYWLRRLIGPENIHRMIGNALQCLSYPELNRHFLCNFLDLMVEKMIPNVTEEEFLKKYVYMHTGMR